jgi:D-alanine-D-alanine ligase-like ATP-grasp enzyme
MNQNLIDGGTVAVLLGGTSAERAISLESGNNVVHALEQAGAHVLPIDPAVPGWMTQLNEVSFVFNLLHGPGGEDGTIQGLLDLMQLPYSGSGVLGSALSMDKIRTKVLWQGAGFPTPDFRVLEARCDWDAVIAQLGTAFVKPSLEGSSLGMAKVSTGKELEAAYQQARLNWEREARILKEGATWIDYGDGYALAWSGDASGKGKLVLGPDGKPLRVTTTDAVLAASQATIEGIEERQIEAGRGVYTGEMP